MAQVIALQHAQRCCKIVLVSTAPEGGEDIMHLDKPELAAVFGDWSLQGCKPLGRLFYTSSAAGREAATQFVERSSGRTANFDRPLSPEVAAAQMIACQAWEQNKTQRLASLRNVVQPCIVVHGANDAMIAPINSYRLAEHIPNATFVKHPDSEHGALNLNAYHTSFPDLVDRFLSEPVGGEQS